MGQAACGSKLLPMAVYVRMTPMMTAAAREIMDCSPMVRAV